MPAGTSRGQRDRAPGTLGQHRAGLAQVHQPPRIDLLAKMPAGRMVVDFVYYVFVSCVAGPVTAVRVDAAESGPGVGEYMQFEPLPATCVRRGCEIALNRT